MLVLSRGRDETIMIGDDIEVTIVDIRGDKVRLGITAPATIPAHRKEVYEAIQRENREAAKVKMEDLLPVPAPLPVKPRSPLPPVSTTPGVGAATLSPTMLKKLGVTPPPVTPGLTPERAQAVKDRVVEANNTMAKVREWVTERMLDGHVSKQISDWSGTAPSQAKFANSAKTYLVEVMERRVTVYEQVSVETVPV